MILSTFYLTPHFTLEEFEHTTHTDIENKCPYVYLNNLTELAWQLEKLRAALGGKPIFITSGYRCPELNAAVGGAKNSFHLKGCAVDIRCDNLDDAARKMATLSRLCPDFDELFIEGNIKEGRVWLHFAYCGGPALLRSGIIEK